MTQGSTDNTGASMTVELDLAGPISSYTVFRADGTPVGTTDFVAISGTSEERIFFHTEVCQDFGERALVALLVSTALTDSIRESVAIVPLCPMFARHLRVNGHEFIANGGVFRQPTPDDIGVITRATLGEARGHVSGRIDDVTP